MMLIATPPPARGTRGLQRDTVINPDIAMNNHQCAHQRFSASSVLSSMSSGRLSGSSGFISSFPNIKDCSTMVSANYSMKQ